MMTPSTIFICIVFVISGVIGWRNPITNYEESGRAKRLASDEEELKYYTTPPSYSSEDGTIEGRLFTNKIVKKNENYNVFWPPSAPLGAIVTRQPPDHQPSSKSQTVTPIMKLSPTPAALTTITTPKTTTATAPRAVGRVTVASNDVLEKLEAAIILRENAITVMGYLLQLPRGRLTRHQYASLEMIYNALRQKTIYLYNLLPVLQKMEGRSGSIQFVLLLNELSHNPPLHLSSVINYWIKQITNDNVDLNGLLESMKGSPDLLAGITKKAIELSSIYHPEDELEHYDDDSKVTEEQLGKVYVKIFQQLSLPNAKLPQLLFGLILLDLPNPDGDPVFDEYVKYVAEEAKQQRIPNWNSHGYNPESRDPSSLLGNLIHKICRDGDVSPKMKKILMYILNHFESSGGEHFEDSIMTRQDDDLKLILLPVAPLNFDESIHQLGLKLQYAATDDNQIDRIVGDSSGYIYRYPRDQILSHLAKVQTKLTDGDGEIERIVSALLSNLILIKGISSPVEHYIPLWTVIDVIDEPGADPKIREMINYITHEMYQNVDLWNGVQQVITLDSDQCVYPKKCVLNMLEKMKKILIRQETDPQVIAGFELLISAGYQDIYKEEHSKLICATTTSSTSQVSEEEVHNEEPSRAKLEAASTTALVTQSPTKVQDPVGHEEPSIFEQVNDFLAKHSTSPPTIATTPPPTSPATTASPTTSPTTSPEPPVLPSGPPIPSKLPPHIDPSKCIIFVKSTRGPPVVQTLRTRVDSQVPGAIILPSVLHLEEKPSNNTIILDQCHAQMRRQIVKPLKAMFGKHYVSRMLGKHHWSTHFPTKISVIIDVLRKASWNSQVQTQPMLVSDIEATLEALEFVASYILLPLVAHFMDFDKPVTWVTFGNNTDETFQVNYKKDIVYFARTPPDTYQNSSLSTMPLVNPKHWLEPISEEDPFPGLLPQLSRNTSYEVALRPLVSVFHASIITSLLGDDIIPSWYPNKGALFIWTLHRLRASDKIKSDKVLLDLIENYLRIILPPSIYVRVPSALITSSMHESSGRWTVDLLGLMKALPIPESNSETSVWNGMRDFLSKINLLDELGVPLPPLRSPKGEFLTTIIKTALKSSEVIIDDRIRKALLYYEDKVFHDDEGAGELSWVWIQKFILHTDVHVGQTIAEVLPYDSIPQDKKEAYNELVTDLAKNPHLLEVHNELPVGSNVSKGAFVHDYLLYLLKQRDLSPGARKSIGELLPYVMLTEAGARAMPAARVEVVH
ncbi:uncharacterized protein LOC135166252 [Diachasmimorpha longicaudata]|uniref:uncharacterized protein LOC135166252 n=1 Tax=Diachasmimorpha longicaudata TaxID=58733 RepID=UPI0030B8F899